MSVEAISWALNLAPVPTDPSGRPNSACAFVLIGLANHAGPDGTAAFPAVATLMRYTRLSESTVRNALDRLAAAGVITPCSPEIVAAHIKRADRRPQGWNLSMAMLREDLSERDVEVLERQFPGLRQRYGVQQPDPVEGNGVYLPDPVKSGQIGYGVYLPGERGVTPGPEPYIEPSFKEIEPKTHVPAATASSDDGALFGAADPKPAPTADQQPHRDFTRFYAVYPRHIGRENARRAFLKAAAKVGPEVIITGAERFAEFCDAKQTAIRFIPHPATWLNGGRWDDDLDLEQASTGGVREVAPW